MKATNTVTTAARKIARSYYLVEYDNKFDLATDLTPQSPKLTKPGQLISAGEWAGDKLSAAESAAINAGLGKSGATITMRGGSYSHIEAWKVKVVAGPFPATPDGNGCTVRGKRIVWSAQAQDYTIDGEPIYGANSNVKASLMSAIAIASGFADR